MTKRLFAYIGLTMLVTFSVVFYFGYYGAVFTLSFSAVLFIISFLLKGLKNNRGVFILIAAVVIISTFYFNIYNSVFENKTERLNGKTCTISGILTNRSIAYDVYNYEIECDKADGGDYNLKVNLRSGMDMGAEIGDRVTCSVVLKRTESSYYKSRKFDFNASGNGYYFDYTVEKLPVKDIRVFPALLREKLNYAHRVLISGYEAELCSAISLGDKYELSKELYGDFKSTGLSYIIVVSGMHMSIIASYFFFFTGFLKKKRAGRIVRNILIILIIIFYVSVTGFPPSAVRSAIMIIVIIAGGIISRHSDALNSMGFAALLLTLFNPFSVGDVGMLMSFAAVAGLVTILPKLMDAFDRRFKKEIGNLLFLKGAAVNRNDKLRISFRLSYIGFLRSVYSIFAASACAVLAISPVTLLFFGICNPFVILYSILITPFIGILMLFSLLSAVLWYCPFLKLLSLGTAFITKLIAKWVVFAVNGIAEIPFITFYSSPLYMKLWFGITIILLAVAVFFKNRRKSVIIAVLISVIILAVNYCTSLIISSDKTELTVYSAGEGNCVSLKSPYGLDILSCGGEASDFERISEKLHRASGKMKTLIVPEAREKREMRYAFDFMEEFDVEKVMLYYRFNTDERVYRKARECKSCREYCEGESFSLKLSDTVRDEIINIKNHSWQYLSDGALSVLIAPYKGDAAELPDKYRAPDYLVLCGKVENIDELNYGEIIWTSFDDAPALYRNVNYTADDDFIIDFN